MQSTGSVVSSQELTFLLILTATIALLLTEKLRSDVVGILVVIALYAARLASADEALSGFSSEPAIVVAAVFVMNAGLEKTGVTDATGERIARLAGRSWSRVISVLMPAVAALSAFTHHVTTTAMMLPVTVRLAEERKIAPSKLLMPLAFSASLGTAITVIGAPAFLLASEVLRKSGHPGLGIFSIAPIGLALSLLGVVYMLTIGRFLLPESAGSAGSGNRFRLDDYFTELRIVGESPWIGRTLQEVQADPAHELIVAGWLREGRRLRLALQTGRIEAGDVLLVRTSPEEIATFGRIPGVELLALEKYGDVKADAAGVADQLVQAIVAPGSDLEGRSVGEVDFRRRYGALVVGLWRREGWLADEISKIPLRGGDVLVLTGTGAALARVERDRAFLMMVPFHGEQLLRQKGPLAVGILVAALVAAATGFLPLEISALAGAVAMVLGGCVTGRQAYRAIDLPIVVFIAGAIPLGAAMETTGTSAHVARLLHGALEGLPPTAVLLALFWAVAILTQFMSDAATTAIFAPVAIALATALGHRPAAYVVTVAMASVVSFLTPIGHHGNLLVATPGGYRFADFLRVGAPLTALASGLVVWLAPRLWPL